MNDLDLAKEDWHELSKHGSCAICERFGKLTKHHIHPRSVSDSEIGHKILICRECHVTLHRISIALANEILKQKFD